MAVVFLLENLVGQLRSVNLVDEKMSELKTELDELAIHLTQIQPSLEDLLHTRRTNDDDDDIVDPWLKQLQEIFYDAQDMVESTLAEASRAEDRSRLSSSSCVIPPIFNKHQSLTSNIRSFRETQLKPLLDSAPVEFVKHIPAASHRSEHRQLQGEKDTIDYGWKNHKAAGHSHVVGLDDEIHTLIKYLSEELQELDVVSIVGMSGLGKTTLASMVYTDPRIQHKFPTRIWVQVSRNLDINRLCRTILKNFTQQDMSSKSTDELGQIVMDNLKMTKYLIVLDDVGGYEDWEQVRKFLPTGSRMGCKVLLTTRNDKVASNASLTRDPYLLKMLGAEECFELLKLEIFGKHNHFPPDLELAGRSIAKACNGLPLATLVLGGILMQHKVSSVNGTDALRMEWENLCDSINSIPIDGTEKFMENILSLSYSKLPPRLRNCFLYLGIFPQHYHISRRKLVLLWVAEGFVEQRPGKNLEETAEAYLNELINRNLLMVEKLGLGGKAKICRVHDLVRDFCTSKATHVNKNLYQELRNSKYGTFEPSVTDLNCRRLCLYSNVKELISGKSPTSKVRSLLCFGLSFLLDIKVSKDFIRAFKMLRILDTSIIAFQKFPLNLTQSIHLRYLTLSGNFKILPAALTNLWNLQSLVVYTFVDILEIKADIWELENLRHLRTNASIFLAKGKGKGKGGKNLQTITKLSPQSFTNDVSNNARNLKELGISGVLAGSMCFRTLDCLDKLKLMHIFDDPLPSLPPPDSFPPKLKSLVLSSTKLSWDQMAALEKLTNLEVLKLKDNAFVGESWDVIGSGFKSLEILSIVTTNLKYWTASEGSFAKLRILKIENCRKLEEVPLHLGKKLEVLHMYSVTKFAVSCARKIEQEIGCKNQGQRRSLASGLDVQIFPGNL